MTVDASVHLTYVVTWQEISDGLKIQMRHSQVGRWCYRILWGLVAFLVLVTAANVVTRGVDAVGVGAWRLVLIACLSLVAVRWLMALALLGYARHLGEHQVTVDDSGIRTISERHTNDTGWKFYGRCVEDRRVFVLLTPDVWGTGVLILPKRGLDAPQDSERLRELFARHIAAA
ncbi:YcxB family protein [Streptomyces sp. 21So2-11]|uniref:YcxB family protein n=1 Tax=Streptomyces sp. 21So2-11 TaxID=3144408 RepID=UPI003218E6A6